MPLPRIRDGRKLSLMIPADALARLKVEALKRRTIPALIILEALDNYWGGDSEAAYSTIPHTNQITKLPTPTERRGLRRFYAYLDKLVVAGRLSWVEIARAAKVKVSDITSGWQASRIVPKQHLLAIFSLLKAKGLPQMPPS